MFFASFCFSYGFDADGLALGAVEVVRAARQLLEVDVLAHVHLAAVYLHDACARLLIGVGKLDLAVETTRAQQGRIEYVHAVGRSYDLDVGVGLEAVELIEQLQHGALHFAIAGLLAVEALGADGVQLVDEYDGGRLLLGERERVAHQLGAVTDEHLHELRTGQLQEGRLGLRSAGARQQRLARARRAVEQHALGRMHAEVLEAVLVRHGEDDRFDELLDLLVEAADVAVLLRRSLVHLHRLDARVVLDRQLLQYQIRVLVHALHTATTTTILSC